MFIFYSFSLIMKLKPNYFYINNFFFYLSYFDSNQNIANFHDILEEVIKRCYFNSWFHVYKSNITFVSFPLIIKSNLTTCLSYIQIFFYFSSPNFFAWKNLSILRIRKEHQSESRAPRKNSLELELGYRA